MYKALEKAPVRAPADATSGPARSPFLAFDRDQWRRLRADTPLTLDRDDLERLRGLNEAVSMEEVVDIFLPLSRLLNLHVTANQDLFSLRARFLGHPEARKVPFVIGIAGSVAVGKSTAARLLRELLARWPNSPKVDLVTTDGFLLPNHTLVARGLMRRKGFPESYDVKALLGFVADIKAGREGVRSPVYSHLTYDIVPDAYIQIDAPDIVIIEGLNVLQGAVEPGVPQVFVSDHFDFSIYVDAQTADLERWYIDRFLKLRDTAFTDPSSYFHRYADFSDAEIHALASDIWREINAPNLHDNILPTRERASLILEKAPDHAISRVRLRRL